MASKNSNLNKAKSQKNDEFYTQIYDIENELKHYKSHFRNKIIFLNCDDPEYSNFWKYFEMNFSDLGIRKVIATHYATDRPTYKLEMTGQNTWTRTDLQQNGDFRSPECIELLKESDIVITNPPFSLFREYIAQLFEYDKKFLIIGTINAMTYKEIFPLIKENKMWTGYTLRGVGQHWFRVPNDYNTGKIKIEDGIKYATIGGAIWFTNLEHKKRHERLVRDLYEEYTPEKFPKYDNYDAIEVSKVSDIPEDYFGVMGVPITFIDKYNPTEFEILGLTTGRNEFDPISWPTKKYINAIQHNADGTTTSGSKANTRATIRLDHTPAKVYYTADNQPDPLKIVYARVLIRRKQN